MTGAVASIFLVLLASAPADARDCGPQFEAIIAGDLSAYQSAIPKVRKFHMSLRAVKGMEGKWSTDPDFARFIDHCYQRVIQSHRDGAYPDDTRSNYLLGHFLIHGMKKFTGWLFYPKRTSFREIRKEWKEDKIGEYGYELLLAASRDGHALAACQVQFLLASVLNQGMFEAIYEDAPSMNPYREAWLVDWMPDKSETLSLLQEIAPFAPDAYGWIGFMYHWGIGVEKNPRMEQDYIAKYKSALKSGIPKCVQEYHWREWPDYK